MELMIRITVAVKKTTDERLDRKNINLELKISDKILNKK